MTDLDDISNCLGMGIDIDFNNKTITLQYSTDFNKILGMDEMNNCLPTKIFISIGAVNFLFSHQDQAE